MDDTSTAVAAPAAPAASEKRAVAELRNVARVYRMGDNEVRALDDVSCKFREGEYWAIMGSSVQRCLRVPWVTSEATER